MAGSLRFRKDVHLGPLVLHFTQGGFTSWSVRVGRRDRRITWNSQRGFTADLPGPFSWKQSRR
jgi:hypothetical protein